MFDINQWANSKRICHLTSIGVPNRRWNFPMIIASLYRESVYWKGGVLMFNLSIASLGKCQSRATPKPLQWMALLTQQNMCCDIFSLSHIIFCISYFSFSNSNLWGSHISWMWNIWNSNIPLWNWVQLSLTTVWLCVLILRYTFTDLQPILNRYWRYWLK